MPSKLLIAAACCFILIAAAASGVIATRPAEGIIPPFGVALVVDTTEDALVDNNNCSLREAILATNSNANLDNCHASGSNGPDGIYFAIGTGTPTINIGSPLPDITGTVTIGGHSGGADRVELRATYDGFSLPPCSASRTLLPIRSSTTWQSTTTSEARPSGPMPLA